MKTGRVKYILCAMLTSLIFHGIGQQLRAVPDSAVRSLKTGDDFRYANDSTYWQTGNASADPAWLHGLSRLSNSSAMKWLLYLVVAGVAVFIIYQIVTVNNFFVPRRRRKTGARIAEEGGEHSPDDIDECLSAAIAAGEYGPAVRFQYLKTLQRLYARNKIQLRTGATNNDYLQQMQEDPSAAAFRNLTGWYEYVWYGGFQPDAAQFSRINEYFNQFNRQ